MVRLVSFFTQFLNVGLPVLGSVEELHHLNKIAVYTIDRDMSVTSGGALYCHELKLRTGGQVATSISSTSWGV